MHWHKAGNGSRGSTVKGVVVRDSGNRAFVPHGSHGITFTDTVAFDVYESAYWWDPGEANASNDIVYDHAAAMLIRDFPKQRGYSLEGFELGLGTGNIVRDSVVVGALGNNVNAAGFMWPSQANRGHNVWTFTGNVAHNNNSAGLGVWQNDAQDHVLDNFVSYRNGGGISHGAYRNTYTWQNGLSFDENVTVHALASPHGQITYHSLDIGGDLRIAKHNRPSNNLSRFVDTRIRGKIVVNESGAHGRFHFISTTPDTDLTRDDFHVINRLSEITVQNSNGTTYTIH